MPQFIHLADDKDIASIERGGIRAVSEVWSHTGIFAVPILPSYTITHQWLRELKRRGMKTLSAVQFFIPAWEPVLVGSYRDRQPLETTAAGAVGVFRSHISGLALPSRSARQTTVLRMQLLYSRRHQEPEAARRARWRLIEGASAFLQPARRPFRRDSHVV